MPIKPPMTDLPIKTAASGFYRGFTKDVTITAKILVGALILWAVAFPEQAGAVLGAMNSFILASFNYWYVYVMAFFVILCLGLALWPTAGRMKLGHAEDKPEFSNFSWFSMMFGAGIGIGMLTFATAEPMFHWASNPDTIRGLTEGSTAENVRARLCLVLHPLGPRGLGVLRDCGPLASPSYAYRRNLPLTIRSALGAALSGRNVVRRGRAIWSISSRWSPPSLGVSQTLGFGVEQFVAGLSRIGFGDWLYTATADGGQKTSTAWRSSFALAGDHGRLDALGALGCGQRASNGSPTSIWG